MSLSLLWESWSITAEDVYEFMRCPRILAFKLLGVKLEGWRPKSAGSADIPSTLVGRLGEEAVAQALRARGAIEASAVTEAIHGMPREAGEEPGSSGEALMASVAESVKSGIAPTVRDSVKSLVEESVRGALRLVEYLEAMYGRPWLFARARVVNTFLQMRAKPDFIVGFASEKYVIVEVKNSKRTDIRHQVQAGLYLEASRFLGASILLERKVGDSVELKPVDVDRVADSVVVYPRLARVKRAHELRLTPEIAARIMKTKYLAMNGSVPIDANIEYCSRCRYRELCKRLQSSQLIDIDSVSMPVPPSVIAAIELSERYGIDLDMLFHGKHLHELYWNMWRELRRRGIQLPPWLPVKQLGSVARLLSDVTNMPADEVSAALETYKAYRDLVTRIRGGENVLPLTRSEIKALADSRAEEARILSRSAFMASVTCAYPSDSMRRVKEAYTKLQQLLR